MHTVAVFYSLPEAQLFQLFLRTNHVSSFLPDENILSVNPGYTAAVGGIRVTVATQQLELALALYEEYRNGETQEPDPPTCPTCHSQNIMMLPPGKASYYDEFRCFDCDHQWDDRYLYNINPGHIE